MKQTILNEFMSKKEYPYQNRLLDDMEGEEWKDIPGLEMYFLVSNYGRIKRLQYMLEYNDGRKYLKQSRIIKSVLMKIPNEFTNDVIYFLRARVTLFKQEYNLSIARLVYFVFIKPFDIENKDIVILCKDSDGRNIKTSNLQLANLHAKQKRIFDLERRESLYKGGPDHLRGIEKARQANNRQVTKYNMEGKKINTYPSITSAAKEASISPGQIGNVANGIELTAGGFIWQFGNAEEIDISPMLRRVEERKQRNKEHFGKKVTQFNMNGKRVAIYPAILDAERLTGISAATISAVINGKMQSAGGFYWQKGSGPLEIDLEGYEYGPILRAKKKQRKIMQYLINGKYVHTFDSIKEAARQAGVHSSTIIGALQGKQQTAGGYKWEYK